MGELKSVIELKDIICPKAHHSSFDDN